MKHMGFTIIEMVAILGILAVLLSISLLSASILRPKNSLDSFSKVLIANLKQQQVYALSGQTEGRDYQSNYGIYFDQDKYTFFYGDQYDSNISGLYSIKADDLLISTTFPNSSIVFLKNDGQIVDYQPGSNTITLTHLASNQSLQITLSKYGTTESVTSL